MKNHFFTRFLSLVIIFLSFSNVSKAGIETIPTGSFIVNMGVVPQTYGNGIKPWGMIHDLIKNYRVQFKWVINPAKLKDGTDFIYSGTSFSGGTFIIPKKYRTAAVNARIAYWQGQGIVGVTTVYDIPVDVTYTLKYSPRWTFDFQNGNIALGFLTAALIPTASYPKKEPINLDICDDLFVMPHADPTWATHSNLLFWNQSNNGWIWAGCHAVSVLENLSNPLNVNEKMSFLSEKGLVPFGSHNNGSPPYSYRFPTDPEMQFMGIADGAMQNGSEQIFLPTVSTWRASTKVAVYDPTHAEVPSLSPGEAAAIVYGRAFGNNARGKVMYTGGHNIEKGTADAVSAMRAFFNFSFLSVYDKVVNFLVIGAINLVQLNTYNYQASLPTGTSSSNYTFQWESTCGGGFSNPTDSVTFFTAPAIGATCVDCIIYCIIRDPCGREYYQEHEINICPTGSTLSVNLVNFTGSTSAENNLLQWTTSGENNSHHFDLEYSTDGTLFSKIGTVLAQGNSNGQKEYSFIHQQVRGKTAYYRLKIVDNTDNYKYSNIAVIKRDKSKYIVYPAYPNPFNEKMTVTIESPANKMVELYLSDVSGKIIRRISQNLTTGVNNIELEQLNSLSPGIYILKIKNDEINNSIRLFKAR